MGDGSAPGQCPLSWFLGLCLLSQELELSPFLVGRTGGAALLSGVCLALQPPLPCVSPNTRTGARLLPGACRTTGRCCWPGLTERTQLFMRTGARSLCESACPLPGGSGWGTALSWLLHSPSPPACQGRCLPAARARCSPRWKPCSWPWLCQVEGLAPCSGRRTLLPSSCRGGRTGRSHCLGTAGTVSPQPVPLAGVYGHGRQPPPVPALRGS